MFASSSFKPESFKPASFKMEMAADEAAGWFVHEQTDDERGDRRNRNMRAIAVALMEMLWER